MNLINFPTCQRILRWFRLHQRWHYDASTSLILTGLSFFGFSHLRKKLKRLRPSERGPINMGDWFLCVMVIWKFGIQSMTFWWGGWERNQGGAYFTDLIQTNSNSFEQIRTVSNVFNKTSNGKFSRIRSLYATGLGSDGTYRCRTLHPWFAVDLHWKCFLGFYHNFWTLCQTTTRCP